MTGGGAKGLYEAGVINAFHISGMEFDVITGSSIGAMNSVFFAEYLYRKHKLSNEIRSNPEKAVVEMDRMVRQFHHAWLTLPEIKIIDDGETGSLGKLKNDLLEFNFSIPKLVTLGWWWTDPQRVKTFSTDVVDAGLTLVAELVERLGGPKELLRIVFNNNGDLKREALRTYLARFDMDRSIVPDKDDQKLKDVFTGPVTPLREAHLSGDVTETPPEGESGLVDPDRTMRDYYEAEIDVRLTRANFRTGRLEISSYFSQADFIRWLERQAWRLQSGDPDKIPLGSFRLQMPGNANAINAGLASGRFPGVFAAYPITSIYPSSDPENARLYDLLANWMDGQLIKKAMKEAYLKVHQGEEDVEERWERIFESWRTSDNMKSFFANLEDAYVDGGAIDNTPSNSVIDAVREWVGREGKSKRDVTLDNYVIFLHKEPIVKQEDVASPTTFELVGRTLEIQSAAKLASDADTIDTINYFGEQGDELGQALLALLEGLEQVQPDGDGKTPEGLEEAVRNLAKERDLRGFRGSKPEGILKRLKGWSEDKIGNKLPLHVDEIIIHPEEMAMSTLQFTERLGYRKENAIDMLTMGCYNTLWALRGYLEGDEVELDEFDQKVLAMLKKWMGFDALPGDHKEQQNLHKEWKCQRTECVYHAKYCPRGAGK